MAGEQCGIPVKSRPVNMMEFKQILAELQKKVYHPVYMLHGEEPYYIDVISDYIETNVLTPEEKEFNLTVLYGGETNSGALLDQARRYPVFSERQVIIVKEAQRMRDLDGLEPYMQKPVPSTMLVLCHKYKKLDARTRLAKSIDKAGILFESKKLYDNQVPAWVVSYVKSRGYQIDERAALQLSESIGTDLSRMVTEIDKLAINVATGSMITPELIERFVGVSKEFNVFELSRALGARDVYNANRIAHYLGQNLKENPLVKIIPIISNYFTKILLCQLNDGRQGVNLASVLGVAPVFLNEYRNAAKKYSRRKLLGMPALFREYDLKNKGLGSETKDENELLKELIYKIIH